MLTIHKFPLEIQGRQIVSVNAGGRILTVQFQRNCLNMWTLVDTDRYKCDRCIEIYGTGHMIENMDMAQKYLGTVQTNDELTVWHIFERLLP